MTSKAVTNNKKRISSTRGSGDTSLCTKTVENFSPESILSFLKVRLSFIQCSAYSPTHKYLTNLALNKTIENKYPKGIEYMSTECIRSLEPEDAVGRIWRKVLNRVGQLEKGNLLIVGPTSEWNEQQKLAVFNELKLGVTVIIAVGAWPEPRLGDEDEDSLFKRLNENEKWWMQINGDEKKMYALHNIVHWLVQNQHGSKAADIMVDFSWAMVRGIRGWEKDMKHVSRYVEKDVFDDNGWQLIFRAVTETRKLIEKKETLGQWERDGRELAWQIYGRLAMHRYRYKQVKSLICSIEQCHGSLRRRVDRDVDQWE